MTDLKAIARFDAKGCLVLITALVAAYIFLVFGVVVALNLVRPSLQQAAVTELRDEEAKVISSVVINLLTPPMLIVVTLLVLGRYFPTSSWLDLTKRFGFEGKISKGSMIVSFLIGVVMTLFYKTVMSASPPGPLDEPNPSAIVEQAAKWTQLLYAINLVTLVPVAEEFVFRGVLYKGFMLSWNKVAAAGTVCVIFTLAHIDTLNTGYWLSQMTLIVLSIIFVVARDFTGSLYSPILIHSGFNFGSVFIT